MTDDIDTEDLPAYEAAVPTEEQVEAFDITKTRPLLWEMWCACQLFRQLGFQAEHIYALFANKVKHDGEEHDNHACVILRNPPHPDFTLIVGPFVEGDHTDWPVFVEAVSRKASDELMAQKFMSSWSRKQAPAILMQLRQHGISIPAGQA